MFWKIRWIKKSLQELVTTYETSVFEDLLFLLFLAPQIRKSVDDDTENQIEHDNDDDEEEEHVVHYSSTKHRLLKIQINRYYCS